MKSKKKTKVPAYAFGTQFKEIGNNLLGNAPDILNTLTTPLTLLQEDKLLHNL